MCNKWNKLIFYSMSKRGKVITQEDTLLYDRVTKIQTKILGKLSHIKRDKPNYCCKHFESLRNDCDLYDPHTNYYQKYWKLFLLNQLCFAKLQASNSLLSKLEEKVGTVEALFEQHQQLLEGKVTKRKRRLALEVEKNNQCPYPNCFKNYSTDASLNLHIKIKHNGGNKSDRERAAQMIWEARKNNQPIPNFYINLPPGFIENYKQTHSSQSHPHPSSIEDEDESQSVQDQSENA